MALRRPEVTNERRKSDEIERSEAGIEAQAARLGSGDPARITFGPFVLDPDTGRLFEGEHHVPLAPKPFETLLYLARHPGRVVPKSELMERIWPGTFVTDDVLVQCVVEIRRALGDSARTPEYVETIPRKGYQFLVQPRSLPGAGFELKSGAAQPAAPSRASRAAPGRSGRWLAAGAGLALVAFALLGRRDVHRAPAPAKIEPGSLLVLPVRVDEPGSDGSWLRQGLAELIRSELSQQPGVSVIARHRISEALSAGGSSADVGPVGGDALALARGLGAERLVTGSFVRLGEQFVLTAQFVDVRSGGSGPEIAVRGRYPTELLGAVDDLCRSLAVTFEPGSTEPAGPRPVRLATRSIDAYRDYTEALGWYARGGSRGAEEAERRLDAAVELDPSFAFAYLKKAEIQQWRRRLGYGDEDPGPALRAAARLSSQLPERERVFVQMLEAQILAADPGRALELGALLLRQYPSYAQEVGVPRLMAEIDYSEGRWGDLIDTGQAYVDSPALPGPERAVLAALLAKAFRQRGEFDQAIEDARRAVRLWPSQEGPSLLRQRTDLGRVSLDAGRRAEALAQFRAVSVAAEADVTNLTDAAWGLYLAGQRAEAEALVQRALSLDASYGNAHHLRGWLLLARGRYAEAAASLERAFELTPSTFGAVHLGFVRGDIAALYYSGVAWHKAGRPGQANAAFERVLTVCQDQLDAARGAAPSLQTFEAASYLALAEARLGRGVTPPPRLTGDDATYYLESSRLHALLGQRERAITELRQALALAPGECQHLFDDPNFVALRGDPEFARLTAGAAR
jgi:DNA-binding winged helix-turn-helix (wHTH) protein/tetratricopeptide (TPR) repeat protein/TolB-like protein